VKKVVVMLLILSVVFFGVEVQFGWFEYPSGAREFFKIYEEASIGPFTFSLTHWLFIRIYNVGIPNPYSFIPISLETSAGWWDVKVQLNINENVYLFGLHRSVHNFDGLHYLYDRWHNFYGIGISW